MTAITFRTGNDLDLDQIIEMYAATSLGVRRPLENREAMANMLRHANLVITAWEGSLLVGIARSLTDFSFVVYLSDLAVRESHQRRGIGRDLIQRTRESVGPQCKLVLLAAPLAVDYYPRLGFTQHPSAWTLDPHETLL